MIQSKRLLLSQLISLPGSFFAGAIVLLPGVQEPQDFQIRVNVDLVVLQVTVQDRNGSPVVDLSRETFSIYEDGVRQEIKVFRYEDSPVTVGLVVDHSGSMRNKLDEVAVAAKTFVQLSSAADEMFVVNFNEHVTLGLPAEINMSNSAKELSLAISRAPADGMTALYDAVIKGLDVLSRGNQDKKVLVVVSDGGDTASVNKVADMMSKAEMSTALIYTLGIFDDSDPDRRPEVLRRLARISGGEALFPKQPQAIITACARIAKEIRQQYTLAYVSKNDRKPGSHRSVRVTVNSGSDVKLTARTRAGYVSKEIGATPKLPNSR